jgi:2,6-dihydroxypyridine 3-monooxygenase
MRVIVIGGSVGGLTAALVLRDAGYEVDVFERSTSALESRGAGIILHPMTVRYFVENAIMAVEQISTSVGILRYLDKDGSTVQEGPCGYRATGWNTLYRALVRCLEPQRYHLGEALSSIEQEQGGSVWARFASGRQEPADLLVCADGISSTARALLSPETVPVYAGYVGWRGTVPESELGVADRGVLGTAINYHLMPDSHVVAYPIPGLDGALDPGRRLINFVWYRNVAQEGALPELMIDRAGTRRELSVPPQAVQDRFVAELQSAAERLPPSISRLVRKAVDPFIQQIVDVQVPQMVYGRACLVGDAAFVARPHAAAGTAKAAADAWALQEELLAAAGDLDTALTAWNRRQLALGRALVARVQKLGARSQFGGGWRAGDPSLRFGLWKPGDSEAILPSRPQGLSRDAP